MSAVWCSECNEIFNEGMAECPFCGAALGALPEAEWSHGSSESEALAKWPEGAAEAFLTTASSASLEDETLCSMLGAYGIPTARRYPNDGSLGKIILGSGAGVVDIFVPDTMIEDAKRLLDSPEAINGL